VKDQLPRASYEELEIRVEDGTILRAITLEPPADVPVVASIVLAHAMFARKSSFGRAERPGLAFALAQRGFQTVAFDFRGHGESTTLTKGRWRYDDLVRVDVPAVVACVRARADGRPVLVLGHSLGGHVTLAAQGTGRCAADAIVAVATNVWLPQIEPSTVRWAAKRLIMRGMIGIADRAGGFPARQLRLGSDDASREYVHDLFGGALDGAWKSSDGTEDYLNALGSVTVPVAAVLGDRDRLMCHPVCGEAFARLCGGPVRVFHAPGSHMELVTSDRAEEAVTDAVFWALRQARP
jgi:alpha-beta hydrolase superfamily lysophospholipase